MLVPGCRGTIAAMTAAIITLFIVLWLAIMALIVASVVFWVFMLIDVLRRSDWQDENEKTLWIVLVLVIGQIGAIAYYFAVRQPRGKAVPAVAQPTEPKSATKSE